MTHPINPKFDRRAFLATSLIAGGAAATPALALADIAPTTPIRQFEVTTTVTLPAATGPAQLWLPVFHSDKSYQHRLAADWQTSGTAHLKRDATYGAQILAAHWDDAPTDATGSDQPRTLTLTQRVATWDRPPLPHAHLSTADRQRFTAATPHLPTDGLVRDTATRILAAAGNPSDQKAQVRALYDWMVVNTFRDPATPGCGTGDVNAMLASGRIGGKCVDLSGLMVAMSRSIGIPARDVYGLRLAPSKLSHALGRAGDVTGAQHCRAEVWLEGTGWFAVDPADVRKAILEDKLPADSDAVHAIAEHLFGAWESNWGGYNSASGIILPDAQRPLNYDFLMYPAAVNNNAVCLCLDAAHFAYHITSRELTA
jgi:transglutaminase-like putative cysteine protease